MTDFSKTEINVDKKDYSNYRILIVSTSWNREVIDVMKEDAISELKEFNVNHIDSVDLQIKADYDSLLKKFVQLQEQIKLKDARIKVLEEAQLA